MENQDKLYKQFEDAARKEEQKDFARMEAVWNRVEEKLDRKEERRAATWWKYTGIAAALLLFMSLGYILMQNEKHPLPNVSPSNQQVTTTTAIDTQKVQETVKPLKPESTVAFEDTEKKKSLDIIEADSIHFTTKTKKALVSISEVGESSSVPTYTLEKSKVKYVPGTKTLESPVGVYITDAPKAESKEATPIAEVAPALNNNRLNTAIIEPSALYSNSLNKPGDKAYPFGKKTYSGIITDDKGLVMPAVAVSVKGTNIITHTDFDGKFSLQAEKGNEIEVSYIGFESKNIKLEDKPVVEISMKESQSGLGEVVVDSYRLTSRPETTAAVATVTAKTVEGRPNASFVQSLQGQVPGLNVTSGSGTPGSTNNVQTQGWTVNKPQTDNSPVKYYKGKNTTADGTTPRLRSKRGDQLANFKTNTKDKEAAATGDTDKSTEYRDGYINTNGYDVLANGRIMNRPLPGQTTAANQANTTQALQGRVAGVYVNSPDKTYGGDTTVVLRGSGSVYGTLEPLYVVDGAPVTGEDMKKIDPNNIDSIKVLKDTAATSIYGSRGASGVIIITTKEAKNMTKRQFRKLQKKRLKEWQKQNTPSVIIREASTPNSDTKAYLDEQERRQKMKIPVDTEEYEAFDENKFESPASNPLSTFSIDVDNASYTNIRRFINNGQVVPKDAVRVEEMINFFKYNYPQPSSVHPFSINTEYSNCLWNPKHKLLKIGLQGKDIPAKELPASNFVFLIDVSGSMNAQNKLPLLKESMKILVKNMRREDRIAIVVYAGAAGLVLPATRGDEKQTIISALDKLSAGGSTAGGEGIELAYKIAQENFVKGGNNRVILATDGDFNVGRTSNTDMQTLIEEKRKSGVFLTCLGYGMGNYKDSKLETLSDKGNGNYAYIDNMQEADRFLDKEFKGSMYAIAKDVKIQIEFNPSHVQAYRLIGYENRKLRNEDFANDAIDAGELGSGHTVTALYEIIPPGVENDFVKAPELKYSQVQQNGNTYSSELATIKFRYKKPDGDTSTEIVQTIANTAVPMSIASGDFKFAAAVAWFGLKLRDSKLVPNKDTEAIKKLASEGILNDPEGYRAEFIRLAGRIE